MADYRCSPEPHALGRDLPDFSEPRSPHLDWNPGRRPQRHSVQQRRHVYRIHIQHRAQAFREMRAALSVPSAPENSSPTRDGQCPGSSLRGGSVDPPGPLSASSAGRHLELDRPFHSLRSELHRRAPPALRVDPSPHPQVPLRPQTDWKGQGLRQFSASQAEDPQICTPGSIAMTAVGISSIPPPTECGLPRI